jgi:DNA-binding NarL/FixJ family response regulator
MTTTEPKPNSSINRRRIFIVDDHPLVREWLTNLINQQPDLLVCGEAETAEDAEAAILAQKPDAAIVDLSLKDLSGIELIKRLKRSCPKVAVIVLSMHEEAHYAQRALLAGARAYVMKRETTRRVIVAIREVLEGKLFLSENVATSMIEHLVTKGEADSPVATLSDREMQVFELLGKGWGTRKVGEALGINVKTVQAYRARIKDKLHVQRASELLREAVRFHDARK